MAAPNEINWADGDPSYREEPLDAKKDLGWVSEEKPPYQYFNWVLGTLAEWVTYLNDLGTTAQGSNYLRSNDPLTYSAGTITLVDFLDLKFRDGASVYTNRIAAGSIVLADGEVLVAFKSTSATTVTLASGTYGSLAAGQYAIVAESSLSATNAENEVILFRRRAVSAGDDIYGVGYDVLECPVIGKQYLSGERFYIGGKEYGDIVVTDGKDINVYSGNKTGLVFAVDGATGNVGIASGARFYFDGAALSGDSYAVHSSSNIIEIVANSISMLKFRGDISLIESGVNVDFSVVPTKRFYFDGGSDTFAYEKSSNLFVVATAGVDGLGVSGGDGIGIEPAKRFYFDGIGMTGNTYQYQSSSDVYGLVVGGTTMLQCQNNGTLLTTIYSDVNIPATYKFYFDGGSNTSLREVSADTLCMELGGTDSIYFKAGQIGIGNSSPASYPVTARNLVIGTTAGTTSGISLVNSTTGVSVFLFTDTVSTLTTPGFISYDHSTDEMGIGVNGSERYRIDDGAIFPAADSTYDLGTTALAWLSLKVDTINFPNGAVGAAKPLITTDGTGALVLTGTDNGTQTVSLEVFGDTGVSGGISTNGGTNHWQLGGYTAGAPAADGYISVLIDGAAIQLLCNAV